MSLHALVDMGLSALGGALVGFLLGARTAATELVRKLEEDPTLRRAMLEKLAHLHGAKVEYRE